MPISNKRAPKSKKYLINARSLTKAPPQTKGGIYVDTESQIKQSFPALFLMNHHEFYRYIMNTRVYVPSLCLKYLPL